jgi:hypothetical protein
MLYNMCPETLSFGDSRQRQMGQHTSQECNLSSLQDIILDNLLYYMQYI